MEISNTTLVERIARVLAGRRESANAEGDERHAAEIVDRRWRDYRDDALAVLHTLREPDETMAAAGDPEVWEKMVRAALDKAEQDTSL